MCSTSHKGHTDNECTQMLYTTRFELEMKCSTGKELKYNIGREKNPSCEPSNCPHGSILAKHSCKARKVRSLNFT